LAEKYYNIILGIHQLKNSLQNKVPALKNELEEILTGIAGVNHFKPKYENKIFVEEGQIKWLKDRQINRKPDGETGSIEKSLVKGIENLFEYRNDAEHAKIMDWATYIGHFALIAKAISFFSNTPLPEGIQTICDGKELDINDNLNSNLYEKVSSSVSTDNNPYRINGINITEDIGGVEVESCHIGNNRFYLRVHNCNSFRVNVLFECNVGLAVRNGILILEPDEKRNTNEQYYTQPYNYKLIVRKFQNQ
jgi:hypothetical protein